MGNKKCPHMSKEEVLEKFPTDKCSGCSEFKYDGEIGECAVYSTYLNLKDSDK